MLRSRGDTIETLSISEIKNTKKVRMKIYEHAPTMIDGEV